MSERRPGDVFAKSAMVVHRHITAQKDVDVAWHWGVFKEEAIRARESEIVKDAEEALLLEENRKQAKEIAALETAVSDYIAQRDSATERADAANRRADALEGERDKLRERVFELREEVNSKDAALEALADALWASGRALQETWHSKGCPQSLPPAAAPCTCEFERSALRLAGRLP